MRGREISVWLVHNWARILLRAWSVRLTILAFLFQVAEALLPYLDPDSYGIPQEVFRFMTVVILVGAVWARVTPQPQSMPEKIQNAQSQD